MRTDTVTAEPIDGKKLLRVLSAYEQGDFSVRMPVDQVGMTGRVYDALNHAIDLNQRMANELARISAVVGKAGNVRQRATLPAASGEWLACIESVNTLVADLVQPNTEEARVIGAVTKGDLSRAITVEARGEILQIKDELYSNREVLNAQAAALRLAYAEMEQRALKRTEELADSNRALLAEIVERRRAEDERAVLFEREQAARLEAEAMNRLKDEFLGTLSHELRTPLNAILGWTHLLEVGQRDDASIARATRIIKSNAQAQAQLVADILDVSRIISGRLQLYIKPLDPRAVIEATLETLRPAAHAKGIAIATVWPAAGGTLLADHDRLRQVMWNLLSNAIKFTPAGGHVRVELDLSPREVRIVVADDGKGIDAAFLPHVFDRFRQADSSIGRTHGGLGLGMAIVRHLLELHGGSISVHSAGTNQGTTFRVALPVRAPTIEAVETRVELRASSREGEGLPLPSLAGVSVLVVDDEADAREVLRLVLMERGADVRAVASAAAGFRAIRRRVPDVLVSDVGMPGQDGHEFIRKLRLLPESQGSRVAAVALTAYATPGDRDKALAAGFDRHVTKPIVPAEIVGVVASLARRRAASDQAV